MREAALKYAYQMRDHVDSGYWSRTLYFWTMLGVILGGLSLKQGQLLSLLISSVGLVFSLAWYLVNRGSKYWLVNWERHIDVLEDKVTGPLYKRNYSKGRFELLDYSGAYPFSVSQINCLISLYIFILWLGIWSYTFFLMPLQTCLALCEINGMKILLTALTVFFCIGFFQSKIGKKESLTVDFKERIITDSDATTS